METAAVPKPTDEITVIEGFDAMRVFLETVWRREGKALEEIAFLLGGSAWEDGTLADPTIWQDWLMTVRETCSLGER
jgi:putative AlgH/UPF0301 family transcriptional regulator